MGDMKNGNKLITDYESQIFAGKGEHKVEVELTKHVRGAG
jgi:hypothetical protein